MVYVPGNEGEESKRRGGGEREDKEEGGGGRGAKGGGGGKGSGKGWVLVHRELGRLLRWRRGGLLSSSSSSVHGVL